MIQAQVVRVTLVQNQVRQWFNSAYFMRVPTCEKRIAKHKAKENVSFSHLMLALTLVI